MTGCHDRIDESATILLHAQSAGAVQSFLNFAGQVQLLYWVLQARTKDEEDHVAI